MYKFLLLLVLLSGCYYNAEEENRAREVRDFRMESRVMPKELMKICIVIRNHVGVVTGFHCPPEE